MEYASLLWKGVSPFREGLSNKVLIIKPDCVTMGRMEEEEAGADEEHVLPRVRQGEAVTDSAAVVEYFF